MRLTRRTRSITPPRSHPSRGRSAQKTGKASAPSGNIPGHSSSSRDSHAGNSQPMPFWRRGTAEESDLVPALIQPVPAVLRCRLTGPGPGKGRNIKDGTPRLLRGSGSPRGARICVSRTGVVKRKEEMLTSCWVRCALFRSVSGLSGDPLSSSGLLDSLFRASGQRAGHES